MTTDELKYIRKTLGMTQAEMANELFCSHRMYQRYEAGTNDVPPICAQLLDIKMQRHKLSTDSGDNLLATCG